MKTVFPLNIMIKPFLLLLSNKCLLIPILRLDFDVDILE